MYVYMPRYVCFLYIPTHHKKGTYLCYGVSGYDLKEYRSLIFI